MSDYVFKLPDLGEGTVESEIGEWNVKVGDHVDEDGAVRLAESDQPREKTVGNPWFESVAVAKRRARKVLPRSVYGALIAGSASSGRSGIPSPGPQSS